MGPRLADWCVIDLSRFGAGAAVLRLGTVQATTLVEQAREFHQALADEKGIRLAVEEGCDERVRCDRERVHQVLGNLVGNALKFAPAGSAVTLGCASVPEGCRLSVRDEGPGIANELREHLFDRYWQPPHTTARGSGLGLAIAREIVVAHHGQIGVDSQMGAGSTFWFTLPRAD